MTIQSTVKKTAGITGATIGIGAAFAKQGYDLVITGRKKKRLDLYQRHCRQKIT